MNLFKKKIKTPKNTDDQFTRRKKLGKEFKFYKMPKVYTQNEWSQLKVVNKKEINGKEFYLDLHEVLCNKYDIVLIDYRTNKEIAVSILKAINFKNFDKGMKVFDGAMKEFDDAMSQFGKELGSNSNTNLKKITGKETPLFSVKNKKSSAPKMKIWADKPVQKKKRRKKSKKLQSTSNVDMIWGKRR